MLWAVTNDTEKKKKKKDKPDEVERDRTEAEAAEKGEAKDDKDLDDNDEKEEEEVKEDSEEEEEGAKHWRKRKAEKLSAWKTLQTEDVHHGAAARTASPGSSTPGGSSEVKAAGEALWAVPKEVEKKMKDEQDEGRGIRTRPRLWRKERPMMTEMRKKTLGMKRRRKPRTGWS